MSDLDGPTQILNGRMTMFWYHDNTALLEKLNKLLWVWSSSEPIHLDSTDCWCEPEIEELDDGDLLVIHRDKSEGN